MAGNNDGHTPATHKIYFGNYFRDTNVKVSSMAIGSGKPHNTDAIVVLFDSKAVEKSYAFDQFSETTYHPKNKGDKTYITMGRLDSRACHRAI